MKAIVHIVKHWAWQVGFLLKIIWVFLPWCLLGTLCIYGWIRILAPESQ